ETSQLHIKRISDDVGIHAITEQFTDFFLLLRNIEVREDPMVRISSEVDRLRDTVKNVQVREILTMPPGATSREKMDWILETLARLSETRPQPAGVTPAVSEETDIQRSLRHGVETSYYSIRSSSPQEFVMGRRGTFYMIALKSPVTGSRFNFESGKYVL